MRLFHFIDHGKCRGARHRIAKVGRCVQGLAAAYRPGIHNLGTRDRGTNRKAAAHALTDADAISLFQNQPFSLVLLGGGIEPESDTLLREAFTSHNPKITIIQHYGGGSGLLATEINMALDGSTES